MKPYYQDETITLYCGDCADILPHVEPCDVLVTDPPYGVDFKSNRGAHDAMALDGAGDKVAVLERLALALKSIKRGRHIYCFGPLDLSTLPLCGVVPLVWDKEVTGMGDLTSPWGPAHENITFGVYEISAANRAKGYGGLSARMRKGSILRCQRGMSGQTKHHPQRSQSTCSASSSNPVPSWTKRFSTHFAASALRWSLQSWKVGTRLGLRLAKRFAPSQRIACAQCATGNPRDLLPLAA